jgi:hypothetical protein
MRVEEFRYFLQSTFDFLIDLAGWEFHETGGEVRNKGLESETVLQLNAKTALESRRAIHSQQPSWLRMFSGPIDNLWRQFGQDTFGQPHQMSSLRSKHTFVQGSK